MSTKKKTAIIRVGVLHFVKLWQKRFSLSSRTKGGRGRAAVGWGGGIVEK